MSRPAENCRLCGGNFLEGNALDYPGMPERAQNLPRPGEANPQITLRVRECARCHAVQLLNAPVPYYREVIRASAGSPEMMEFRRRDFKNFASKYLKPQAKFIEYGCGAGEYLACFPEGYRLYGTECGEAARQEAAAALPGARIFPLYPGEAMPEGETFDGFAVLNWLEHLPDLPRVLDNLRAALSENGAGIIEVPDFGRMVKSGEFNEFTGDHLWYFTREPLIALLKRHGFLTEACESVWHGYILRLTVRKSEPRPDFFPELPPQYRREQFREPEERLRRDIGCFTAGSGEAAVWGAGHQAFMTLAFSGLSGRFRYIVDSAVFKQGRVSPATGLPIVPPEELNEHPVRRVLVMAGGYSDEVVKILRAAYPQVKEIAAVSGGVFRRIC